MSMFDQWDFYWDEMPDLLPELRAEAAREARDEDVENERDARWAAERAAGGGVFDD